MAGKISQFVRIAVEGGTTDDCFIIEGYSKAAFAENIVLK